MRKTSKHHHFVALHAAIIIGGEFSILFEPVASHGDLAIFLDDHVERAEYLPDLKQRQRFLNRAFGCLVSGLTFLHDSTIRHKDLKPQNILVHIERNRFGEDDFRLLYTDFGSSYDYSAEGHSTSVGYAHGFTKRYCAPEVVQNWPRNTKSDMYSLGCVFIDIEAALNPESVDARLLEGLYYHSLAILPKNGLQASC